MEIRGNKGYEHVKELEKRGLISAVKQGRTKALSTTRAFADYFGIAAGNPQAVRRAILKDRKLVGVSPMYESLALRLGLDFIVVNPYRPEADDLERLEEIDLLVLAPGYAERVTRALFRRDDRGRRAHSVPAQGERREGSANSPAAVMWSPWQLSWTALLQKYRRRAEQARAVRRLRR